MSAPCFKSKWVVFQRHSSAAEATHVQECSKVTRSPSLPPYMFFRLVAKDTQVPLILVLFHHTATSHSKKLLTHPIRRVKVHATCLLHSWRICKQICTQIRFLKFSLGDDNPLLSCPWCQLPATSPANLSRHRFSQNMFHNISHNLKFRGEYIVKRLPLSD